MKILITSKRLDIRVGVGSLSRDISVGLQKLGHSVVAYCSDPDREEILPENRELPVVTNLEELPFLPDVIHSHDHPGVMTALTALPGVPAVSHCHGAIWQTCPPRHPRIQRYLVMSKTLAERLTVESNISPSDITVFLNPVDLDRFREVRALPSRPTRCLFFNSRHEKDSETVSAIQEAASRCGMQLEFIGPPFAGLTDAPQRILPSYDIVFASGMSAIDALASGCAVVVLGTASCGEMVLPENFDRLRQANFSIAGNAPPPSADKIEAELRRYSAERCGQAAQMLRKDADSALAVGKLLEIYRDAVERNRETPRNFRTEMRAVSKYMRRLTPLVSIADAVLGGDWLPAAEPVFLGGQPPASGIGHVSQSPDSAS